MEIIIDIITLVIIIYFASKGIRKGGVKSIFEMLNFFAAAIITALIYKPVSLFLIKLPFAQKISEKINDVLINNGGGVTDIAFEGLSFSQGIQDVLQKIQADLMTSLAATITTLIISILCIIIIYIVVRCLLKIFGSILNTIVKLPVLNSFNKLIGFVFGGIKGLLILFALLALINVFAPFEFFKSLSENISLSYITSYFYDNNILLYLFF